MPSCANGLAVVEFDKATINDEKTSSSLSLSTEALNLMGGSLRNDFVATGDAGHSSSNDCAFSGYLTEPASTGNTAKSEFILMSPTLRKKTTRMLGDPISLNRNSSLEREGRNSDSRLDYHMMTFLAMRIRMEGSLDSPKTLRQQRSESSDIPSVRLERVAMIGKGNGYFGWFYIVKDIGKRVLSPEGLIDTTYSIIQDSSPKRITKPSAKECLYGLRCWKKENTDMALNEKKTLQEMGGSPFIMSLHGLYHVQGFCLSLTEFLQGGSLFRYIRKRGKHAHEGCALSHEECVFFSANIVCALSYLHEKGFIHRDVRPESFFIGSDGYLKLCNFGLSKKIPYTMQLPSGGTEVSNVAFTNCGIPNFFAPEIFLADPVLKKGYGKAVDWWAFGSIVVEMYTGLLPFSGFDEEEFRDGVVSIGNGQEKYNGLSELEKLGLEYASDLVSKLLTKDSERLGRNGSREVQEHKYFSQIDFQKLSKKELKAPFIPREWEVLLPALS